MYLLNIFKLPFLLVFPSVPGPSRVGDPWLEVRMVVVVVLMVMEALLGLQVVALIVDWLVRTLCFRGVRWRGGRVRPGPVRGPGGGQRS